MRDSEALPDLGRDDLATLLAHELQDPRRSTGLFRPLLSNGPAARVTITITWISAGILVDERGRGGISSSEIAI